MSKKVKKKVKQKNKNKNVKEGKELDTVVKEKSENGELPITDEEYQSKSKRFKEETIYALSDSSRNSNCFSNSLHLIKRHTMVNIILNCSCSSSLWMGYM